jgi:2-polyprenyl-3-methyl-5-hydroxy-6-metoxy-1,4-benzoquinol methylase
MELFNPRHLIAPHWNGRNKLIVDQFLEPNKSILDLGCGAKPILKMYAPSNYLGVDGLPTADRVIDLNSDFTLPAGWDYVLCSGIFEHINLPNKLLKKVRGLGNEYIFTWWTGIGYGRMPHSAMEDLIRQDYKIIKESNWGAVQKIYKCVLL